MRTSVAVIVIGCALALPHAARAQTTYHLHQESSPPGPPEPFSFSHWLKTAAPDGPTYTLSWHITNYPYGGEQSTSVWQTSPNVPGQTGMFYPGATVTFTLWMRKTAAWGTVYPGASLRTGFWWNGNPDVEPVSLCKAIGTTPLTKTWASYTFSCTVQTPVAIASTDRLAIYPFIKIAVPPGNHNVDIQFAMEGTMDSKVIAPSATPIPVAGNCPAANPNDQVPDDAALNACLAAGGPVILSSAGTGYLVDSGLTMNVNATTLTTGSGSARLVAGQNLRAPILRVGDTVANYFIANMIFDGNRAARVNASDCAADPTKGTNLLLRGGSFMVRDISSVNALCGAGIDVDGNDFEIKHSVVTDNGFEESDGIAGGVADGIAVNRCVNGYVHDNQLADNTDADIMVGLSPAPYVPPPGLSDSCYVMDNTITHTSRYGRAGIHVGGNGDHKGADVRYNNVSSDFNQLAFGILIGQHPYDSSAAAFDTGYVYQNTIDGAVVPLAIDGISAGQVYDNTRTNAQGWNGFGTCPYSTPYTARHFGTAYIDAGYVERDYHDGTCNTDYAGCFANSLTNRTLSFLLGDGMNQDVLGCRTLAADRGFLYAGLENGGQCWGGNTLPTANQVDESECDMACTLAPTETCGGAERASVHATTDITPPGGGCTCDSYVYHPGRFSNVTNGDVVVTSDLESVVLAIVSEFGEYDTHVVAITDWAGFRITDNNLSVAGMQESAGCDLDWGQIRDADPGVRNNVLADGTNGLNVVKPGTVLEQAAPQSCTGGFSWYHIHGFGTHWSNSQCAEFQHDSCGVEGTPSVYPHDDVFEAAITVHDTVVDTCMSEVDWPWYATLFCDGGKASGCSRFANQIVNEMLYGAGYDHNDWFSNWAAAGDGTITGVLSPTGLKTSNPSPKHNVTLQQGYYTCEAWTCP